MFGILWSRSKKNYVKNVRVLLFRGGLWISPDKTMHNDSGIMQKKYLDPRHATCGNMSKSCLNKTSSGRQVPTAVSCSWFSTENAYEI